LFVCTGNSARSQIAASLMNAGGRGRFVAESAGSRPAPAVNPIAVAILEDYRVPFAGRAPRSLDGLDAETWDFVITVCDRARESCPIFPGQPVVAHWGMADPAEVTGDDATRREAFRRAFLHLKARIDLFLSLPMDKLDRMAREARVRAIGAATR
jgi:arsenate reductase